MKNGTLRIAGIVLDILVASSVSACAPAESNVSAAQPQQTLRWLRAAREIDLSNASDPAVGPVASGDYSIRAENAAQVISDLEHGQYVSQSQIDDAQFVPPKSLSLEQRARLINCTSSEPIGQVSIGIKRGSGSSELKFWLQDDAAG